MTTSKSANDAYQKAWIEEQHRIEIAKVLIYYGVAASDLNDAVSDMIELFE